MAIVQLTLRQLPCTVRLLPQCTGVVTQGLQQGRQFVGRVHQPAGIVTIDQGRHREPAVGNDRQPALQILRHAKGMTELALGVALAQLEAGIALPEQRLHCRMTEQVAVLPGTRIAAAHVLEAHARVLGTAVMQYLEIARTLSPRPIDAGTDKGNGPSAPVLIRSRIPRGRFPRHGNRYDADRHSHPAIEAGQQQQARPVVGLALVAYQQEVGLGQYAQQLPGFLLHDTRRLELGFQ